MQTERKQRQGTDADKNERHQQKHRVGWASQPIHSSIPTYRDQVTNPSLPAPKVQGVIPAGTPYSYHIPAWGCRIHTTYQLGDAVFTQHTSSILGDAASVLHPSTPKKGITKKGIFCGLHCGRFLWECRMATAFCGSEELGYMRL